MAARQFYLLGEDPSTAKEIDISTVSDEEDLKHTIAAHFAIVQSSGTKAARRHHRDLGHLLTPALTRSRIRLSKCEPDNRGGCRRR